MKGKKYRLSKYTAGMLVCSALMLIELIGVALWDKFGPREHENAVGAVTVIFQLVMVGIVFFLIKREAERTGKTVGQAYKETADPDLKKRAKRYVFRATLGEVLRIAAGAVAALAFMILGVPLCGKAGFSAFFAGLLFAAALLTSVFIPIISSIYEGRLEKRIAAGEKISEEAPRGEMLRRLASARRKNVLLGAAVLILGASVSFFGGALAGVWVGWSTVGFILGAMITAADFLRFPRRKRGFARYVSDGEYPEIKKICRRAASEAGFHGRVELDFDSETYVTRLFDTVYVFLDAQILNIMTPEETYCLILREILAVSDDEYAAAETYYIGIISRSFETEFAEALAAIPFFAYTDLFYRKTYEQFDAAFSGEKEREADAVCAGKTGGELFVSTLMKRFYLDAYENECIGRDAVVFHESGERWKRHYSDFVAGFLAVCDERREFWNSLAKRQINDDPDKRSLVRDRIEAVGAEIPASGKIAPDMPDGYRTECIRALEKIDAVWAGSVNENDDPSVFLDGWESSGRLLNSGNYGAVISALISAGRTDEALDICLKAIASYPGETLFDAYYFAGNILLARYDRSGAEYLLRAAEIEPKYRIDASEQIKRFYREIGDADGLADLEAKYAERQIPTENGGSAAENGKNYDTEE
ncbi:MAG: hypothetical protein IJR90_06585 [Clostridia bacterium]|nr:hypothetical protein [Clostridia bacterium]